MGFKQFRYSAATVTTTGVTNTIIFTQLLKQFHNNFKLDLFKYFTNRKNNWYLHLTG